MIRTPSMFGLQRILSRITGAGTLIFGGAVTADRTQNAQDKSGTIALTSDIVSRVFQNLILNGRVPVDQRATLATPVTASGATYGPDGWLGVKTNATMVATIGKVAVVNTPMVGSLDACKLNVTTAAALSAAEQLGIRQRLEGTFFRRCGFGTAQAVPLYLSFWAESTVTGTFSIALRNGVPDRSYIANFTIAAANTRQLCQVTIPGDTSGTWATDTSIAAQLDLSPAVGSTYLTTAGVWQAGNFLGTSSATLLNNVVGSLSISDIYLGTEQIGTATSDYPHVPLDVEALRCKRYLQRLLATGSGTMLANGLGASTTVVSAAINLPVDMRVSPSLTVSNNTHFSVNDGAGVTACTSMALGSRSGSQIAVVTATVAAGLTQFRPYQLTVNTASATFDLSAEL